MMQESLFKSELIDLSDNAAAPKRLHFFSNFISQDEEQFLIGEIKKLAWQEVKMHGVVAKRKVAHFGVDYTFAQRSVAPTTPPPQFLMPFLQRVASFMKLPEEKIGEVLVTHYPAGAAIGWHRDAPPFGDAVCGISLLSDCTMKFRLKRGNSYEIFKLPLPARSAYIFSGEARWKWEHTIAQHKEERYSITFRTLKT